MTYRECYAKHVQLQHLVDDVHLRHCPGFLRALGEPARYGRELDCPYRNCVMDDNFATTCAACWDKEMEVLK